MMGAWELLIVGENIFFPSTVAPLRKIGVCVCIFLLHFPPKIIQLHYENLQEWKANMKSNNLRTATKMTKECKAKSISTNHCHSEWVILAETWWLYLKQTSVSTLLLIKYLNRIMKRLPHHLQPLLASMIKNYLDTSLWVHCK